MTILPQLERDLLRAATEEARVSSRPRRARRTVGSLALALSAAVVIAVAIVALATLGRGGLARRPAAPHQSGSRAELIGSLAILRRRQTAADLDPQLLSLMLGFGKISKQRYIPFAIPGSAVLARFGYPELDRSLVRVVDLRSWRAKVLIAPVSFRPLPRRPQRSEGVELELWVGRAHTIPPSSDEGTGPAPTALGTLLAHGLGLAVPARGKDVLYGAMLVPDGVARVELGSFVPPPHSAPHGVLAASIRRALATMTSTGSVHENLATFELRIPRVTSVEASRGMSLFGFGARARAVWLDLHGRVIRRTTTDLDVLVAIVRPRAGLPTGR